MATITPPSDFWPPLGGDGTTGVFFATPPLFIAANTVSISDATDTQPGAMTTVAQPFGGVKDFTDGIRIATGTTVTEISTDGTLAANSDSKVPTQKAVKTYVDTATVVGSVVDPLYIVMDVLHIHEAGIAQTGTVTTLAQTFGGTKTWNSRSTFSAGLDSTDDIRLTANPAELLSYSDSIELRLRASTTDYNVANTGLISVYPASSLIDAGGIRAIPAVGATFKILHTADALIAPTTLLESAISQLTSYVPINVIASVITQLTLSYDLANFVNFHVNSSGDLTINATGQDINLHSTDKVHILNTTPCTGIGTGALTVGGGASFSKQTTCYDGFSSNVVNIESIITFYGPTTALVNSAVSSVPLTLYGGQTPVSSVRGSGILLHPSTSGGQVDIFASDGKDINFYTGADPQPLALALKPANLDINTPIIAHFYNTMDSTLITNGCATFSGGIGVAKAIRSGSGVYGATITGASAGPQLYISTADLAHTTSFIVDSSGDMTMSSTDNGEIQTSSFNKLHVYNTTEATSATAAFIVDGGILAKKTCHFDSVIYDTPVYRELNVLNGAHEGSSHAPSFATMLSFEHWSFPTATDAYLYNTIALPPDMVEDSPLCMRLHWCGNTVPSAGDIARMYVLWQVIPLAGNMSTITTGSKTFDAAIAAKAIYYSTTIDTITPSTGGATSVIVALKFGRLGSSDAADTYGGSIFLLALTMSYQSIIAGRSIA